MKKLLIALLALALVMASAVPTVFAEEEETMIVSLGGDPLSFNPVLKGDDDGFIIHQNIFDGLLELNYKSEIIPGLATSWEASDDGLTYTFHLSTEAKWHDGVDFTSADVKYTYERVMAESGFIGGTLSNALESIECPDDDTVVLTLKVPDATLLGTLAWYEHGIIPKHIYENETDWASCAAATTAPIGTGPYKFVDYQSGVSVTLEKNEEYFGGAPEIDKLIFLIVPDDTTGVQAFYNGEIDVLTSIPTSEVLNMQNDPEIKLGCMSAARRFQMVCNMENETMQKWEVRKAVALSIDREEISRKATSGLQAPAYGFYPPFLDWAYNAEADIGERDVAKAMELLEQAGYTKNADGFYLTLTLDVFSGGSYADCGKVIQANLKEAGIDLKLNVMEMAAWSEKVESGNYELAMLAGYQGPDPDAMGKRIGTGAVMNYANYSNPRVDELLVQGRQLVTHEDRGACYKEIQSILAEDLPIIPVVEFASYRACYSEVYGNPYIDSIDTVHDGCYSKAKFLD